MESFVLFGFVLATFFQVEGRSINTMEELTTFQVELGRLTDVCIDELSEVPNSPLQAEEESALNELWGCIFGKKGIINKQSVLINEGKLEDYIFDMIASGTSPALEKQIRTLAHGIAQQCRNVQGNNNGQTAAKLIECVGAAIDALPESD